MALRTAWWMQKPHKSPQDMRQDLQPHEYWPWNQPSIAIGLGILEAHLRDNAGSACKIDVYPYEGGTRPRWRFWKRLNHASEVLQHLHNPYIAFPRSPNCLVYIIRQAESEAIQALGYHLSITPRFFYNLPYTRLNTGNPIQDYLLYSLQFMEKYKLGVKPSEARRSDTSPHYRFRTAAGAYHNHEWHITCIRLIYLRDVGDITFRGVIQIDPADDAIADGLNILMLRDEEKPLGDAEKHAGLARLLSNTIYIVYFTWTAFFIEAESHIQFLSTMCLKEQLASAEQLQYTRELHQLSPLWVQVRRRLVAAKHIAEQMIVHPFFRSINGFSADAALEALLVRKVKDVDDQISHCNELAEQTNVLISLILNIATLQDTKAAVEQSKAANILASSIRRVTMLTFIYLPLTLASSIFGMNITQITGMQSDSPLSAYFILATSLMCATFGGWFIWSRSLSRLERRASRAANVSQKV